MTESDPTRESFRQILFETQQERAAATSRSVETLDDRIETSETRWNDDHLRARVATILSESIREAGHADAQDLAKAIAPHIIATIRREIGNSHPEIIEALSPRIGDLIRAALAKAMQDIQRQIDDAVPVDVWIATIKSKLTGSPSVGWLVESTDDFRVLEAYLIERGSGLLLSRNLPPDTQKAGGDELDDDLLAAMIAALDAFVRDAFGGGGVGDLKQLTLTAGTVYLRASPTKILALRCSGTAPPRVEEDIDQLLLLAIRRANEGEGELDSARLLENMREAVPEEGVSAGAIVGKGIAMILAAMLAVWGHFALESFNRDRWVDRVQRTAIDDPALLGYPMNVSYDAGRAAIVLQGLVPDEDARAALEARLLALPPVLPYDTTMPVAGERLTE